MNICLSKDNIQKFIDLCTDSCGANHDYDLLQLAIENATSWDDKIILLLYFLSHILEVKLKHGIDCNPVIKLAYELKEKMWVVVEGFDYKFIEYMLYSERNESLTLEEELIELMIDLEEHRYGKSFRT